MSQSEDILVRAARVREDFAQRVRHELLRPFRLMRTSISLDGGQWCVLYGENLQDGVAGFGESPDKASRAFDLAWYKEVRS